MKTPNLKPFTCRSLLFCFAWVLFCINTCGQAGINISKPQLRLENNNLIITYSIFSENPNDKFNVQLRIADSTGTPIKAESLSGDIGDSIGVGNNKTIIWNLAADRIYINAGVFVEVNAEKLNLSAAVPDKKERAKENLSESKKKELPEEKKGTAPVAEEMTKTVHTAETGKNLILSAVVPGWGLTRLSDGKPWWILAVADAGCVAAAVYYNRKASSNYTNYLNSSDATVFDPYYEDASKQNTLSKVFGWSAVGIWAANMCYTAIRAVNAGKALLPDKTAFVRIGSYYDHDATAACLSVCINF